MSRSPRSGSKSPTELTMRYFEERGFFIGVVERYIGPLKIRLDFMGFADLIAYNEHGTIAVQACVTGDVNKRIRKILGEPQGDSPRAEALAARARNAAVAWLMHPNRGIIVIGWRKYKKGDDGKVVRPTVHEMTIYDFM